MAFVKKLIFAPPFFISFAFLLYQLNPLFKSYDFIFAFSVSTIIQLIILAVVVSLTSLFFVLFAIFAYDWKLILVIGILALSIPIFFLEQSVAIIFSVGTLATLLIIYMGLENTLKTYLNFSPASLFGFHIRRFATFIILVISLTYFLSISRIIQERGFQIPDSLIEQALKIAAPPQESSQQQTTKAPASLAQDTLKEAVKGQFEGIIKPYLSIIPAVLAVLFFFVLQSLVSLLNLLIYPLLWGIFYILEKSGFIKFTEEQRTVKKIVV